MGTLSGTTVMITGASRGLGRALARAAAREGAALAICARGGDALEAVAEECRANSVEVLAVLADIADASDVERFAATALERFGGIDVLVNNAAELGPLPLPQLTDAPSSALEHVLQANVLGPLRLTQAVTGQNSAVSTSAPRLAPSNGFSHAQLAYQGTRSNTIKGERKS